MGPLLTVVMPCYNAARWLHVAIGSVLEQKEVDLELIAVDDGSSDNTRAIVENYACRDRRVCPIFFPSNRGIVHSLNAALDVAQGAFIARMDADDIAMSTRFSRQIDFLCRAERDLCGSWFIEFGQGLSRSVRWPHTEEAVGAGMLFQNTICHPTVMARREVFERYRYRDDYRLAEDYDLFVRASSEFRLANLPEVLLRYRRHSSQATRARRDSMEVVTQRIRFEALRIRGFDPSPNELTLHNLIRTPRSITDPAHLAGIEAWLLKLLDRVSDPEARRVVASQWVRACVRASPLGGTMWHSFVRSPLCLEAGVDVGTRMDLRALALLKLDYRSAPFELLRRFGLSV